MSPFRRPRTKLDGSESADGREENCALSRSDAAFLLPPARKQSGPYRPGSVGKIRPYAPLGTTSRTLNEVCIQWPVFRSKETYFGVIFDRADWISGIHRLLKSRQYREIWISSVP